MRKPTLVKLGIVAACLGVIAWRFWPWPWWPAIETPRTNAASEG